MVAIESEFWGREKIHCFCHHHSNGGLWRRLKFIGALPHCGLQEDFNAQFPNHAFQPTATPRFFGQVCGGLLGHRFFTVQCPGGGRLNFSVGRAQRCRREVG